MVSTTTTPVGALLPTAARLWGTAVPFAAHAAAADARADQQVVAYATAVLGAPPPRGAPV